MRNAGMSKRIWNEYTVEALNREINKTGGGAPTCRTLNASKQHHGNAICQG